MRSVFFLSAVAVGCGGSAEKEPAGGTPTLPETVDTATEPEPEPETISVEILSAEILPALDGVVGAKQLVVSTDVPSSLTAVITSAEHTETLEYSEVTTDHDVPLVGFLLDAEHTVELILTHAEGSTASSEHTVVTGPLPDNWPTWEVLASEPERMAPGYTLFAARPTKFDGEYVVIVDGLGRPRWIQTFEDDDTNSVRIVDASGRDDGTLLLLQGGDIVVRDLLGHELQRIAGSSVDGLPEDTVFHHEVGEMHDGTLFTLAQYSAVVPEYPRSGNNLHNFVETQVVVDAIVELSPTGVTTGVHRFTDLLDPRRVGYNSFGDVGGRGLDWTHTNGVTYRPSEDAFVVSVRHLGTVFQFSRDTGEIDWILSDPLGWREPWSSLLLAPLGKISWPYHQHAAEVTPRGTILLHDNHNYGQTIYHPGPPLSEIELKSRLVEFDVDAVAGTVEEVWAHEGPTGPYFSSALGDADWLAEAGTVLGTWGMVTMEDGVRLGVESRAVHVAEVETSKYGEVLFHLRITASNPDEDGGWSSNRAERLPSLLGSQLL